MQMNHEKSICLNMIVRNEAAVIARCLASVLPIIDYWVICDTGSTDETPAIIAEALASVPGELHHHTWVNFGVNRTQAIKIAETKADYVLLVDADMILNVHRVFKAQLSANAYMVRNTGALDYWETRLVDSKYNWQYMGPTHEYVYSPSGNRREKIDAISVTHFADGGARADKFTRDISLLETALIDEPNNGRYLFYLAQSHANLGDFANAIKYYHRRIDAGGWDEERWYAMYQLGAMLEKSGAGHQEVANAYLRAYEYRPSRAEPLYHLAKILRDNRRYALALLYIERALKIPYPQDILFIEKPVYDYLALFEFGISAHYAGAVEDAIRANDMVIGNPLTPAGTARQAVANKRFSLRKFINERGSAGPKRIAAISYDLNSPGGSGISLKSLLDNFSRNNWPVWSASVFPADQVLQEWKPDILISQQWATKEACRMAQRLQIPLIKYVHGPGQYEFAVSAKMKPDFLVFCSSHEYFLVKKKYPEIEGMVLHPVLSVAPEKGNSHAEYITLIGNTPNKGNTIFLAIAARMPEEKFLLVGELNGDEEWPKNVKHHPYTNNIDEVYRMTKLLLAPSINESYCRVVVEAARHGIVSVVTGCRGIREATGFENAIYIFDRADIGKWVEEIKAVLKHPEKFSAFPKRICDELDTELELQYAALKIADWAGK